MTTDTLASLPDTAGSGRVAISILNRAQLRLAPDGVFFRAAVSDPSVPEAQNRRDYDPSFHDCVYLWDFGDPGAASDKVVNVAAAHNDLNCAWGKEVGHVYTRPGRYTITCTVEGPMGRIGQDTTTLEVLDPDEAFPAERTILVDPDEQGDPERYPDAVIVPGLDPARGALEGLEETGRILIRRGVEIDYTNNFWLRDSFANAFIGTYGEGPRPIIRANPDTGEEVFLYSNGYMTGDLVLQGLDLRGPWNAETETGRQVVGVDMVNTALNADSDPNPRSAVLDDCLISGFGMAIYLPSHVPRGAVPNTHINNCRISDWASYGIYGQFMGDSAVSITGTVVAQNENAPSGGSLTIGEGNSQGPLRTTDQGRFYIAVSDFFSRCGWTRISDIPADQPCVRWNTSSGPEASAHIERCAFEGGVGVVTSNSAGNPDALRHVANVVLEKCLIVGTAPTLTLVSWDTNGATFRNNLMIRPDTLIPYPLNPWEAGLNLVSPERVPMATPEAPVRFYSNTYVNLMGAAARADSPLRMDNGLIDEFEIFSNENNIFHTPKQPLLQPEDPGLERSPLETVGGTWRSRYLGLRYDDLSLQRAYATPERSVHLYGPAAGSAALNSAVGRVAFDDFLGRVRSEEPDRGATEAG